MNPSEWAKQHYCCAVRRGEARHRLDPHFHSPIFRNLIARILAHPNLPIARVVGQSEEMWNRKTSPDPRSNAFRYLEISAVGIGTNDYTLENVPIINAPSRARMFLRGGDIVVSSTRPHRGAIVEIKQVDEGAIASTGFIILREHRADNVRRDFLLYVLQTSIVLSQFLQRSSGGAYPAITSDEVDRVLIPIPSDSIQKKLVAMLDDACSKQREKLAQADKLLSSLDGFILETLGLTIPLLNEQREYAVRFRDIRVSRCDPHYHAPYYRKLSNILYSCPFDKVSLGTFAPDLAGGATPKRGDQELYADNGVKFLRIMNIVPYEMQLEDIKYITTNVHEHMLGRSQLQAGDILMTITGRVGTCAIVPQEIIPANINQHIVRIRIKDKRVTPEYLVAYLNSSFGLALTNRGVTGGTRIATDYEALLGLYIPIPNPKIQDKISREVKLILGEAKRLRIESHTIWDSAIIRLEEELLGHQIS